MNCQEFENHLADALGGELDPTVRAAFLEHLAACATCRCEYESATRTVETLRSLPVPPRVVVRRERGRLILEQVVAPGSDARSSWRRWLVPSRVTNQTVRYAAAVLLAFTAGFVVRGSGASPTSDVSRELVSNPSAPRSVRFAQADIHGVLAGIYAQHPARSDLAKALMAVASRAP